MIVSRKSFWLVLAASGIAVCLWAIQPKVRDQSSESVPSNQESIQIEFLDSASPGFDTNQPQASDTDHPRSTSTAEFQYRISEDSARDPQIRHAGGWDTDLSYVAHASAREVFEDLPLSATGAAAIPQDTTEFATLPNAHSANSALAIAIPDHIAATEIHSLPPSPRASTALPRALQFDANLISDLPVESGIQHVQFNAITLDRQQSLVRSAESLEENRRPLNQLPSQPTNPTEFRVASNLNSNEVLSLHPPNRDSGYDIESGPAIQPDPVVNPTSNVFQESKRKTFPARPASTKPNPSGPRGYQPFATKYPLGNSQPEPHTKPTPTLPASEPFEPPTPLKSPEPTAKPAVKPEPKKTKTPKNPQGPSSIKNANDFLAAAQPKLGDRWKDDTPLTDRRSLQIESSVHDFSPDPVYDGLTFDPLQQRQVYEGKTLNANQRPLIELGRPWYQLGQLAPPSSALGFHNPVSPQFVVYGDSRVAAASNTDATGDNVSQLAFEVNLNFDLRLTATERFVWFLAPVDSGFQNTSHFFDADFFNSEFDADIDFGYFEGDLGAIVGGFIGQTLPFDAPFAIGVLPLLFQNGIWLEDAFLGVAATVPARNSARLGISNLDVTFFAGYDKITSDAFEGDDNVGRIYGIASFIEATNGFWEVDYAYLEDRDGVRDRSYHNIGIGFTRRFGRFLSNSTRVIVNAGQSTEGGPNTADGVLLLSENSLITGVPSSIVPYLNLFAGFDNPQSAARAAGSGGILRNTGILFESDGITGFPTLDATANDTFGGALGINIMPNNWSQQLVLEAAALGVMNSDEGRNARGAQAGIGFRYQLPLTNAVIFRADGMYAAQENDGDLKGIRMELRHKF